MAQDLVVNMNALYGMDLNNSNTVMSELAFYRLNFVRASEADYGVVEVRYTAFSVQINTERAVNLLEQPFSLLPQ